MRILPVIDILNGTVVRGVAGNRDNYRPIQSQWTDQSTPLAVADALFHAFHVRRFYLADLDGILRQQPNRNAYQLLFHAGYELIIDAGVRELSDIEHLLETQVRSVILGLETLRSPELLAEMIQCFGAERIIFSLDLRRGLPNFAAHSEWNERNAMQIADRAVTAGVTQMIVLDLADVGTNTGGSTAAFCREVLDKYPQLTLIAGGGVRSLEDVRRWSETGIEELLVASALHDGRLAPDELAKEGFTSTV